MKKLLSGLLAFALTLTAAVTPIGENLKASINEATVVANAEDNNIVTANFIGKYQQSSARDMLPLINEFRTGGNAWVWDENNTTKVPVTGRKAIAYDYELEKVAMQRAAELVALFSHTRPNGQSCFTAYTSTYTNKYMGENISIGTSNLNTQAAFDLWKEENEPYSGQGHRRNMLNSNFTSIGIAHVYYNGCHYWVQEFSNVVGSSVETPANDNDTPISIEIKASSIKTSNVEPEYTSKEIEVGEAIPFPALKCTLKMQDQWSSAPTLTFATNPMWSVSSGKDVLETSNDGHCIGLKAGEAELSADCGALGIVKIKINVSATEEFEGDIYYQKNLNDDSQIRFVAEINIEDAEKASNGNYIIKTGDNEVSGDILTAYRSIRADGQTVKAHEGKCFIVTPTVNSIVSGIEVTSIFKLDIYNNSLTRTVAF